jgi:hypothetical protein
MIIANYRTLSANVLGFLAGVAVGRLSGGLPSANAMRKS